MLEEVLYLYQVNPEGFLGRWTAVGIFEAHRGVQAGVMCRQEPGRNLLAYIPQ